MFIIHGKRHTPENMIWRGMKDRCLNIHGKDYKNYGARGIRVCDRWKGNFMNFYMDMGPRPSANHSLDRIDNNGDYSPENCRWSTKKEQANNRRLPGIRTDNTTGFKGVSWDKKRQLWYSQISRYGRHQYLGHYKNIEDALEARRRAEEQYEEERTVKIYV